MRSRATAPLFGLASALMLLSALTAVSCRKSVCVAGQQNPCACSPGVTGFQTCREDGSSYGQCECAPTEPAPKTSAAAPTVPATAAQVAPKSTAAVSATAARTNRVSCPGGEVPTEVSAGCMCNDGEIRNPCPGIMRPIHHLEGRTCIFECGPQPQRAERQCQECTRKLPDGSVCALEVGNALPWPCCESESTLAAARARGFCQL